MGTSGAYGGSPAAKMVRDQTKKWLDAGGGSDGENSPPPPRVPLVPPPDIPGERPPVDIPTERPRPSIAPALAGIISGLGTLLASGGARSGGGGGGGGGGGLGGRGTRTAARASTVGGRALGGAYGARTGSAGALTEIGLDLAELSGLNRYAQAKRILDAALGPKGDVMDSELRKTNAEVVLWALSEETEPAPVDLANRWVVEYVWQTWITESGPALQELGANRARAEEEMRAALEATMSAHALPDDRPLTSADFTAAIDSALGSLRRISGSAA
jgi:hypothetical protein